MSISNFIIRVCIRIRNYSSLTEISFHFVGFYFVGDTGSFAMHSWYLIYQIVINVLNSRCKFVFKTRHRRLNIIINIFLLVYVIRRYHYISWLLWTILIQIDRTMVEKSRLLSSFLLLLFVCVVWYVFANLKWVSMLHSRIITQLPHHILSCQ